MAEQFDLPTEVPSTPVEGARKIYTFDTDPGATTPAVPRPTDDIKDYIIDSITASDVDDLDEFIDDRVNQLIDATSPLQLVYDDSGNAIRLTSSAITVPWISSATAPSSPTQGTPWYDTANDEFKIHNGTTWVEVGAGGISIPIQSSPPSSPDSGDLYIDTDDNKLYRYDGSSWVAVAGDGTSGITSAQVDSKIADHNTESDAHADIRTMISNVMGTTLYKGPWRNDVTYEVAEIVSRDIGDGFTLWQNQVRHTNNAPNYTAGSRWVDITHLDHYREVATSTMNYYHRGDIIPLSGDRVYLSLRDQQGSSTTIPSNSGFKRIDNVAVTDADIDKSAPPSESRTVGASRQAIAEAFNELGNQTYVVDSLSETTYDDTTYNGTTYRQATLMIDRIDDIAVDDFVVFQWMDDDVTPSDRLLNIVISGGSTYGLTQNGEVLIQDGNNNLRNMTQGDLISDKLYWFKRGPVRWVAMNDEVIPIKKGGTGANTASAARTALGLGSAATLNFGTSENNLPQLNSNGRIDPARLGSGSPDENNVLHGDGAWKTPSTGITGTVAITQGGTGATTVAAARTNLGLGSAATKDVGTDEGDVVELGSSGLLPVGILPANIPTDLLQTIPITKGGTGATTAPAARTNLGLGNAATKSVGNAAGNLPEVGSGGTLDPSIIPTGDEVATGATIDIVFRRASSQPDTPSASDFTASSGAITAYASGWSASPASGSDPVWALKLRVSGSSVQIIGTPYQHTGNQGIQGIQGRTGAAGVNAVGSYTAVSSVTLPDSWTQFTWYSTGYTPDSDADYIHILSDTYPEEQIRYYDFTQLTEQTAGDTFDASDSFLSYPVTDFDTHYTMFIGRTTDNEILIGVSDADAAWSTLWFRTYEESIGTAEQTAAQVGHFRYTLNLFRQSSGKPDAPTVGYDSNGFNPRITHSSDWQVQEVDDGSGNPLWMATAQAVYFPETDTWALSQWVVLQADDGFDLQYSSDTNPADLTWRNPPRRDESHATPDNFMRYRIPGTSTWSPAIRIRDRASELEWTQILNRGYVVSTGSDNDRYHNIGEVQLSQFNEIMFLVEYLASSPIDTVPRTGRITEVITKEMSGGEWRLRPRNSALEFNSDYTYRMIPDTELGFVITFNDDTDLPNVRDNSLVPFFFQFRRANTTNNDGDSTLTNRVDFFGIKGYYDRVEVSIYGR